MVILVSDFITPDHAWEKSLRAVAAKHDVVAAQIMDPREITLPDAGRVCLEDPETGEQILVNTSHPAVRERYARSYDNVAADLAAVEDLRVLDFNGHQIMTNFSLSELGEPIKFES